MWFCWFWMSRDHRGLPGRPDAGHELQAHPEAPQGFFSVSGRLMDELPGQLVSSKLKKKSVVMMDASPLGSSSGFFFMGSLSFRCVQVAVKCHGNTVT